MTLPVAPVELPVIISPTENVPVASAIVKAGDETVVLPIKGDS